MIQNLQIPLIESDLPPVPLKVSLVPLRLTVPPIPGRRSATRSGRSWGRPAGDSWLSGNREELVDSTRDFDYKHVVSRRGSTQEGLGERARSFALNRIRKFVRRFLIQLEETELVRGIGSEAQK